MIDAALNSAPGPSYEPFPSEDERRDVASAIIQSVSVDPANTSINAASSDRHHEVGFTVRVREAYSNAGRGELRIDTAQLQRLAAERRVKHLKLSLCDTTGDSFTASGSERLGCVVWDLEPTGAPVSIRARVASRTLAATGDDLSALGAAMPLICIGFAFCFAAKRCRDPSAFRLW
ncbi:MAG: hypothetical protein ABI658_15100 [Acidimicrobiales bacterium]